MAITQLRKGLFEAFRGKIYYGWIILAACTVMFFASGPGQSHTFSIFIQSLNQELGIEQAGIASAYGFATLFAALMLPRLGRLVDRQVPHCIKLKQRPDLRSSCCCEVYCRDRLSSDFLPLDFLCHLH